MKFLTLISNKLHQSVNQREIWHRYQISHNVWVLLPPPHTHTRLTALCPGLPGTRKVKPIWILLKQETVSGSGISWAICKSAPHSRQITTPAPHHSVFTGRMPFLPPNQQRQSTTHTAVLYEKQTNHPSQSVTLTSHPA